MWPRIKTPAIGDIAQQSIDGKCNTVEQIDVVRIGTINVETMKGRNREVGEMLTKRRIDICCVQETQYKDVKFLGKERKATGFYGWEGMTRQGEVKIVMREELEKEKEIVEVKRITTRIIKIKLVLKGNLMHMISAYAP